MISRLGFYSCTLIFLFALKVQAQKNADVQTNQGPLFKKGERGPADRFTGTVWVNRLVTETDSLDCTIANVTFEPGARTNWHNHPGGQVLLISEGNGYYQEKGKPIQLIRKGDVIKCSPGVEHWHGASPESTLTHLAIATNAKKGAAVWLQKVTDEEYRVKK